MIYLFGNCQTDFLATALRARGAAVEHRALATPLALPASPGRPPAALRDIIEADGLTDYLHARSLASQFQLLGPDDAPPTLLAFNLFHENEPLFLHQAEGWVFYVDPAALGVSPALDRWMRANCHGVQPRPETYLDRFARLLQTVRARWPDTPLLLLGRLSHWPAFGPNPTSYLRGWDALWPDADRRLTDLSASLGRCRHLSLDRVFAGVWSGGEKRIEAHCPFLRLDETPQGLLPRRDVEHVGSLWSRLADKLLPVLAGDPDAPLTYAAAESVPADWSASAWTPERQSRDELARRLFSGDNYATARAVAGFFFQPEEDFTDLVLAARARMPVCHNTLHMLRRYALIKRNKLFLLWIEAHRDKIRAFTHNGQAYQRNYEARLDEMTRALL